MVKELIDKTSTSTGLKVMTSRKEKVYKTARKASEDFRGGLKLKQDHAFETDSSQFPFSSFFLHPLRQRCRQLLQQQQRLLQLLSQPGPQAWATSLAAPVPIILGTCNVAASTMMRGS
jgi:hypothetical protein